MLTRAIEYDLLPTCQRHGMGVLAYSPLAGGWLSGKYRKGREVSGPGSAARTQRMPERYLASDPSNAAKLDAADAIVGPGVTVNVADNMWEFGTTALRAQARRRAVLRPLEAGQR